ncbi:RPM1-interacting protein 4 (RIN4) family protein [Striga asiatica]|uniref:RPM1-interacting protein 4 (RIN4) family protein n=1 Tax=Striga asiatica TaxID=4170 RepID=A0A5A7Q9I5_STRAF|nr:RPM1-interacting protein 4 (RIN4) family protein [Striga asiatica]
MQRKRMSVPQFGAWDGKSETNYSVVFSQARANRRMHKNELMARHSLGHERELLRQQYENSINIHDLHKKEKKKKKKKKKMGRNENFDSFYGSCNFEWWGNYSPSTSFATQQHPSSSSTSLEEIVKSVALSTLQFQQETRSNLKNLADRLDQLVSRRLTKSPKLHREFMEESEQVVVLQSASDLSSSDFMDVGESNTSENLDPNQVEVVPAITKPLALLFSNFYLGERGVQKG